jgi:hypothetical protein
MRSPHARLARRLSLDFAKGRKGRRRDASASPDRRTTARQRLAAEHLEPRTLLAVTAGIVGSDLRISLGAAHDRATLTGNGTTYVVSGTGLRTPVVVDASSVHGSIVVQDTAGKAGQSFVIDRPSTVVHPLQVGASVESTTIAADLTATGPVSIDSRRTRLAGGISTAATSAPVQFGGAVSLGRSVTINAGAGHIVFTGTVDGPYRLVANTAGMTVFGAAVGGRTPLASLTTNAEGATVLSSAVVTNAAGGQIYGDAVLLAGAVTTVARTGSIEFLGTVDSNPETVCPLTVHSAIATTFAGPVGAMLPLASLLTTGRGTTVIAGGSVTTAPGGRQRYEQPVRLAQDTLLNAGDGTIRFVSTVDGTSLAPPGAPTDLVAKRGQGQVTLSWTAPTSVGGGVSLTTMTTGLTSYARAVGGVVPLKAVSRDRSVFAGPVRTVDIIDYIVQSSADGGATWRTVADGRSTATTATVRGGTPGRNMLFRVWGVNARQSGIAATVAFSGSPSITFHFVYGVGAEYWSPAFRQALEATAATVASTFVVGSPVDLTLDVTAENSPTSGILAWANSDLASSAPGFARTVMQEKVLTGVDRNGTWADGVIHWNFGYRFSHGDTVSSVEYDFRSTVMHELVHAFGFLSYLDAPGMNTSTTWTGFDGFVVNAAGTKVIDAHTFQWDTTFDPNLTGGNGGLFFGGTNAIAVYGGPVPLLTVDPVRLGSSFSHLDDYTFVDDDEKLMNAFKSRGLGIRVISPVERAILADLGYTVTPA